MNNKASLVTTRRLAAVLATPEVWTPFLMNINAKACLG
jgi:hypothetical protein